MSKMCSKSCFYFQHYRLHRLFLYIDIGGDGGELWNERHDQTVKSHKNHSISKAVKAINLQSITQHGIAHWLHVMFWKNLTDELTSRHQWSWEISSHKLTRFELAFPPFFQTWYCREAYFIFLWFYVWIFLYILATFKIFSGYFKWRIGLFFIFILICLWIFQYILE